ncbi:MAG TPA: hypothetical protein VHG89_04805 [Verrucomicrobiae bacterium]|nr:hypothetical protein [Verrucomicrobiae bacterium]
MADRILLIRALVESARDMATEQTPLTEVLSAIRTAIFNGDIANGKVLLTSIEAGGTTTFALPAGHTPLEVMALVQEALDWCNQFSDPDNPPRNARRIRRLRGSFGLTIPQ